MTTNASENKSAFSRRSILRGRTPLAAVSAFGSGASTQKTLASNAVGHASNVIETVMPLARIEWVKKPNRP
jgi:hypothetical protein